MDGRKNTPICHRLSCRHADEMTALKAKADILDGILANVPDSLQAGYSDDRIALHEGGEIVDASPRLDRICRSLARILVNVRDKDTQ